MSLFKKDTDIALDAYMGKFPLFKAPSGISNLYDLCVHESIAVPQDFIKELKSITLHFTECKNSDFYSNKSHFIHTVFNIDNLPKSKAHYRRPVGYVEKSSNSILKNITTMVYSRKDNPVTLKLLYALNFFLNQKFKDDGINVLLERLFGDVFVNEVGVYETYNKVVPHALTAVELIENLTQLYDASGLELKTQIFQDLLKSLCYLPHPNKALVFVKTLEHIIETSGLDYFPPECVINNVHPVYATQGVAGKIETPYLLLIKKHLSFFTINNDDKLNSSNNNSFDIDSYWKDNNNFPTLTPLIEKNLALHKASHAHQVRLYHFHTPSLRKKLSSFMGLLPGIMNVFISEKALDKSDNNLSLAKLNILFDELNFISPLSTKSIVNHMLAPHINLFKPVHANNILEVSQQLMSSSFITKLLNSNFSPNESYLALLEKHALVKSIPFTPSSLSNINNINSPPPKYTNKI